MARYRHQRLDGRCLQFIEVIEKRQGLKIACLESIAYEKGWINDDDLRRIAAPMAKNQYGQYLLSLIKSKEE